MSQRELSDVDELAEMEERTNSDGTVDVTIEEWERVEVGGTDRVEVTFELIDSTETETMPWPQPGDSLSTYKFYKLLQQADIEMRNAGLLEGESVRARFNSDTWKLDVSKEKSTKEKVLDMVSNVVERASNVPWKNLLITLAWTIAILVIAYSTTQIA